MKNTRRGYLPEYEKWFKKDIETLHNAFSDWNYLINRGYKNKSATQFIMQRYSLSEKQRLFLARTIATKEDINARLAKTTLDVRDKEVYVDGFNAIIILEAIVCQSPVFICQDYAVRDVSDIKGNYHIICATEPAIKLLLGTLEELGVRKVHIHLDKPISNSIRLKCFIEKIYKENGYTFALDIKLLDACDKSLYNQDYVVSGDSIVMDNVKHIVPLYLKILDKGVNQWVLDTRRFE